METVLKLAKGKKYLSSDRALVDNLVPIILDSIKAKRKVILFSPPNSGKTTLMEELAVIIKKELNKTTAMALPTKAINLNKYIDGVTFKNCNDGMSLISSNSKIDMIQGVYDSTFNLLENVDKEDFVLVVDEVHNLYSAMSFRYEALLKAIENSSGFIGLSGTPSMLKFHPDYDVITIKSTDYIEPKEVYFCQHSSYSYKSIVDGILREDAQKIKDGDLISFRINNYKCLVDVFHHIKLRYPHLRVASTFSSEIESKGRNFMDCNTSKKEEDFKKIQTNVIDNKIDILLSTQIGDEGLDAKLEGLNKLGKPRHLNTHIINSRNVIYDETTGKPKGGYTLNSTPEEVAQISNRERSGNQTTTVHGNAGEGGVIDYKTLIKNSCSKEEFKGMTSYELMAELQETRRKLDLESFMYECLVEYNISITEKETPANHHLKDGNATDGQLRPFLHVHHNFDIYKREMELNGNGSYIQPSEKGVRISDASYAKIGMIISIEMEANRLDIPFKFFITSEQYRTKDRDLLIDVFKTINHPKSQRLVNIFETLTTSLNDFQFDTKEVFFKLGKDSRAKIKKLSSIRFNHGGYWNLDSFKMKYDPEFTYPDYWKKNEGLKPQKPTIQDKHEAKEIEMANAEENNQLELPIILINNKVRNTMISNA